MKKRVNVYLDEDEYKLIRWLAKNDGVTEQTELQQVFYVELEQLMALYFEEMKQDLENNV